MSPRRSGRSFWALAVAAAWMGSVYFLTTSAFRVLAVLSDDSIREASTGVSFPAHVKKSQKWVASGVRRKFGKLKVYAMAFYLEESSKLWGSSSVAMRDVLQEAPGPSAMLDRAGTKWLSVGGEHAKARYSSCARGRKPTKNVNHMQKKPQGFHHWSPTVKHISYNSSKHTLQAVRHSLIPVNNLWTIMDPLLEPASLASSTCSKLLWVLRRMLACNFCRSNINPNPTAMNMTESTTSATHCYIAAAAITTTSTPPPPPPPPPPGFGRTGQSQHASRQRHILDAYFLFSQSQPEAFIHAGRASLRIAGS
ncbi:atpI [Symbiodinium necroappetens]|uniref:AtpI protein n=1 Tax=Symbiodinium necroappetens TaxID=1628268 RepID=A0A813AFW2_9DINO|nr:atpI [Symbiodinium necroappetens]